MAPPGTWAVIYEDATARTSWVPRGLDAWYCGPSFDHYCCCLFYVPETRLYRTSGYFDLLPQHCILPTFSPEQHAEEVHKELQEAVQKLPNKERRKLIKTMATSLAELATPGGTPQRKTTADNTNVNVIQTS